MDTSGRTPAPDDQDPVPVFGSWRAIYASVVVWALVVMALVAVFQSWPY